MAEKIFTERPKLKQPFISNGTRYRVSAISECVVIGTRMSVEAAKSHRDLVKCKLIGDKDE